MNILLSKNLASSVYIRQKKEVQIMDYITSINLGLVHINKCKPRQSEMINVTLVISRFSFASRTTEVAKE